MCVREPELVHAVHAVSGRDRPGASRIPAQFPDHGGGFDGIADGQRVVAGRGDGGGRSDGVAASRAGQAAGRLRRSVPGVRPCVSSDHCRAQVPDRAAWHRTAHRTVERDAVHAARVWRAGAVSRRGRASQGPSTVHRAGACGRCARRGRFRSAGPGARHSARRDGRRRRVRQRAAVRCADGLRRSARGVLRHQTGTRASHAGPDHRRVGGRQRQVGLPDVAADTRTAHPAREGHVEHLHRAGAAGQHGRDVRRLSRTRGPSRDCLARARHGARARPGASESRLSADQRQLLRHAAGRHRRVTCEGDPRASGRSRRSTFDTLARPGSASPSTKRRRPPISRPSFRSSPKRRARKGAVALDSSAGLDWPRELAPDERVPDASGLQHPSLRDRDDALHQEPRAQGHRPGYVDDSARVLHDEAQRRRRDVSGVVARVRAHAPVCAGRPNAGVSADLPGAGDRRSARSQDLPLFRFSPTRARKGSSPGSR